MTTSKLTRYFKPQQPFKRNSLSNKLMLRIRSQKVSWDFVSSRRLLPHLPPAACYLFASTYQRTLARLLITNWKAHKKFSAAKHHWRNFLGLFLFFELAECKQFPINFGVEKNKRGCWFSSSLYLLQSLHIHYNDHNFAVLSLFMLHNFNIFTIKGDFGVFVHRNSLEHVILWKQVMFVRFFSIEKGCEMTHKK